MGNCWRIVGKFQMEGIMRMKESCSTPKIWKNMRLSWCSVRNSWTTIEICVYLIFVIPLISCVCFRIGLPFASLFFLTLSLLPTVEILTHIRIKGSERLKNIFGLPQDGLMPMQMICRSSIGAFHMYVLFEKKTICTVALHVLICLLD